MITQPATMTFKRLSASLHESLNSWQEDNTIQESLGELLLVNQRRERHGDNITVAEAARLLVLEQIQALEAYSPDQAQAIRKRYFEGDTLQALAADLQASVATAKRRSEDSVRLLAQLFFDRERECRSRELRRLNGYLPPRNYDTLIGQDAVMADVIGKLMQSGPPWIVAIIGQGGIGKTAVADAVTRRLLLRYHFSRPIWIRGRPPSPADDPFSPDLLVDAVQRRLEQVFVHPPVSDEALDEGRAAWGRLKEKAHLVIIDDFDLERDLGGVVDFLRRAADPTKFLITSRQRLQFTTGIYHYPLEELTCEDAYFLLTDFSDRLGPRRPFISREAFAPVYDRVGGNPAAVKLVASLLTVWPLEQILADLTAPGGRAEEELHRPTMLRTWRGLTPAARRILRALSTIAPRMEEVETLHALSGLPLTEFWRGIAELIDHSLLDMGGNPAGKHYGLHHLTHCFFQTGLAGEEPER